MGFSGGQPSVGMAALPKTTVDVRAVELRRFVKLTADGRVVGLRFRVPRNRPEFFQDDIFPPTRVLEPSQTADEWLRGGDAEPQLQDLCPSDMTPLSEAPKIEQKGPKYTLSEENEQEQEVTDSLFSRMTAHTGKASNADLAAQAIEGVDESEWDDDDVDDHWTPG